MADVLRTDSIRSLAYEQGAPVGTMGTPSSRSRQPPLFERIQHIVNKARGAKAWDTQLESLTRADTSPKGFNKQIPFFSSTICEEACSVPTPA